MAKLDSSFLFTGSIENLTAYKRRDLDTIILRKKAGVSREKLKKAPCFINVRRNNSEFGGRATASMWIRQQLNCLIAVADYNITGPLNALLRKIQLMDTEHHWGERPVFLSKAPSLLAGFSLNRRNPLESIIRNPLQYTLDRNALTASLDIPALVPGINFVVPWNYPMYRIQAVLGIVPDLYFKDSFSKYMPANDYSRAFPAMAETEWNLVAKGSTATQLNLSLPFVPPDEGFTLLLSVGICYGNIGDGGAIEQVVHAGAGRILGAS